MSNDATPGFTTEGPTTASSESSTDTQGRAQTAKEEAGKVASEAKGQAKKLIGQTKSELSEQAGAQQQRLATGIRSVGEELTSMSTDSNGGGIASELVSQVGRRANDVADWFENRDPGSVLDEVTRFARQRPAVFIGVAAVAGVLAGRLTRSIVEAAKDESDSTDSAPTGAGSPTTGLPTETTVPAVDVSDAGQGPTPGTPLADQAWAETHR